MDFNIDPMSAVVCIRHHDTLVAIDEIVMFGSNTQEMAQEIRTRYPDKHVIIYPDPASRQRKTSAGGRTDLSILQNAGFEVKAKTRHALVRDRINAVNSRLLYSDGQRNLLIDPKCKQTIESFSNEENPLQKQTGPARRGDFTIIENHIEALSRNKEFQALYKDLSQYILSEFHGEKYKL